jgi:peptide/nickel transport system substrate-binding protein
MRSRCRSLLVLVALVVVAGMSACSSDASSEGDTSTSGQRTSAPPSTGAAAATDATASSAPDDTADVEASAAPTGTIRVGTYVDGLALDPAATTQGQPILQYLQPVYDTLIRRNADFTFSPMLATDWRYTNATNTTLEMELRDDVDFTDGTHFDAAAVKANLERTKAGTGAAAKQLATLDAVEVVDPTTVRLHLSQPMPTLELTLSFLAGMMVSPTAFDSPDLDQNPVGSGPFVFDKDAYVAGSAWAYDARPDYWDPSLQTYARLELTLITDGEARFNALKEGQIDIALGMTAQGEDAEAAGLKVIPFYVDWQGLILMDRGGEKQPALADKRVRQALNYAVDRQAIVDGVFNGNAIPTDQIFPETSPGYVADLENAYPYDLEKARQLLSEAGYADGLELHTPSVAALDTYAQALAGMLAEVGVTLHIDTMETGFIDAVISGEYESPVMSFGMEHPATDANLLYLPQAVFNPFHADLPQVDQLMAEAATLPADEAKPKYQEVNRIITDEAWFLVTHRVQSVYLTSPKVGNFEVYQNQAAPGIYGWTISE